MSFQDKLGTRTQHEILQTKQVSVDNFRTAPAVQAVPFAVSSSNAHETGTTALPADNQIGTTKSRAIVVQSVLCSLHRIFPPEPVLANGRPSDSLTHAKLPR